MTPQEKMYMAIRLIVFALLFWLIWPVMYGLVMLRLGAP
jgi:hypothetical protein